MLTLHYFPGNASLAPHVVLEELGLPYLLAFVDRDNGAHKSPAYLRLNPNGLIPVLVDDRAGDPPLVLYETAAICLHLADTCPEPRLMPPVGTVERAHAYKWLAWLAATLQSTLIVYFYPERSAGRPEAVAEVAARAEARVGALLDILDAELAAHGGPWLLGDAYSVLDPYAFMLCRWTRGFGRPARTLKAIGPYLERMLARPAVARTFAQEGLKPPLV